jgi:hypothetical protein
MGWKNGVLNLRGLETFRLHVQTSLLARSGAYPASYPMGTGHSFPKGKRPGYEVDHSSSSSVEVKNAWSYTLPIYTFMAWYLVKHRDT